MRNKMDKDEIKGAGNKAKGSVKQAAGKATGNKKLEAEGAADKAKGHVQQNVGKAKDALRKH
ncbi:CsbD family protein [Pelagibacterium luteolum]|uniref:CsbD family protein n=1 Tax=Pelagibacterium luteolum TaxID=440168 RepID=UPI003CC79CCA